MADFGFQNSHSKIQNYWLNETLPPTGSGRLPATLVSDPDHEIEPHVTATDPEDE
jgi:hypothetical protein